MADEDRTIAAIGEIMGRFGVTGLEIENEDGEPEQITFVPHEPAMMPASGFGDVVATGDTVLAFLNDALTGKETPECEGKAVKILEVSVSENFCLVEIPGVTGVREPGGGYCDPTSFALQGPFGHRRFDKVG